MKKKFSLSFPLILFLLTILLFLITNLNLFFEKKNAQYEKIKKEKEDAKVNGLKITGKAFFDYKKEKIDDNLYLITIILDGDKDTRIDAADFSLFYDRKKIEIIKIDSGEAFSLYPQKQIDNNKILISAVSQIKNNQIIYAKLNTSFILIKAKIYDPDEKNVLILNPETGIYYSGKNIADFDRSFTRIIL